MMPRTSTPPTGPRTSSPAGRGGRVSRGGIQKRRAGPARVDKDGDLVMDASGPGDAGGRSGRGRPEGASRPRGRGHALLSSGLSRTSAQKAISRGLESQQANIIASHSSSDRGRRGADVGTLKQLRIHGLKESKAATNRDGGLKDLLSFLERKAHAPDGGSHKTVKIKKSTLDGDYVIVSLSEADADSVMKLNDFKFAGATLKITYYQPSDAVSAKTQDEDMSAEAKNTQEKIKAILSVRYDVDSKILNLSNLRQDPGLVSMGMFDAQNRISKLFPVLMVVCDRLFTTAAEKREAISGVTLTDNGLDNVSAVTALAQTFPDLLNLDLSRNSFTNLTGLNAWRWKFQKLQNLILLQNPLETAQPDYHSEIVRWYPALQILNGVQVRTPEEAAASAVASTAKSSDLKFAIPIQGPDFRDLNQIGEGFVKQFFPLYDTDRTALANAVYDKDSTMSISINISAPRSEEEAHTKDPWADSLFRQSRNLSKLRAPNAQISKLHRGVDEVKKLWATFPPTRHPSLETDAASYIIECHPISGLRDATGQIPRGVDGLMLMVHGHFEDLDPTKPQASRRSFSRTFILGPRAPTPGGPVIRVVSDVMVLRAWSPLTTSDQQQGRTQAPSQPQIGVPGVVPQPSREEILNQLVLRTQMTPEYAILCLEETGWDFEKALVAFETTKANLPPNAFISAAAIGK